MCDSSTAQDLVNSCRPRFYWFSLFSSEMKWLSISVSQQLRTSPSPPLNQQQSPHNKFGLTKKTKEHFVKFINSIYLAKAANQIYNRRKQILKVSSHWLWCHYCCCDFFGLRFRNLSGNCFNNIQNRKGSFPPNHGLITGENLLLTLV